MARSAKAGASLKGLIKMAVPLLKMAERECPRTGPGAKPVIPDWFLGVLIMVAVMMRKKSKSAQYRFLSTAENRRLLADVTGCDQFPARSTYFDRYRRAYQLFRTAVKLQGALAIAEGVVNPRDTAIDKSLVEARGPAWHKRDRLRGKQPRGVDADSTWGYSEHHGWTQGYSFEVVVTSTPKTTVFPLLASADVASAAETKSCVDKLDDLPEAVRTVSADSGYDSNAVAERVEYDTEDRRTGRRFLCPENPRNSGRKKTRPGGADAARAQSRARRAQRKKYLQSPKGRRIYRRRSKTVEPFNSWFKSLYEVDQRVWHRGLENNQTQLLAGVFVYQLLVRHNHRRGRPHGKLKPLLDTL
jgi:hypothetical protein